MILRGAHLFYDTMIGTDPIVPEDLITKYFLYNPRLQIVKSIVVADFPVVSGFCLEEVCLRRV